MTTREEIIKLARETGLVPTLSSMPFLEAFYQAAYAAGVAAERNKPWSQDHWTEYEKTIYTKGKAEGMEEAAKVCDDLEKQKWESIGNALHVGGQLIFTSPIHCAAAIREKAAEVTK